MRLARDSGQGADCRARQFVVHTIYAEETKMGCSAVDGSNRIRGRLAELVVGGNAAAAARRVKPVHPELKNECVEKERTDTARRLRCCECDNGLQIGWVVERPWRGYGERRRVVLWIGTVVSATGRRGRRFCRWETDAGRDIHGARMPI